MPVPRPSAGRGTEACLFEGVTSSLFCPEESREKSALFRDIPRKYEECGERYEATVCTPTLLNYAVCVESNPDMIPRRRKPRVWATSPNAIQLLGDNARRMANNAAARLSDRIVAKGIGRLKGLLQQERSCKLSQGDLLVELIDRRGLRPIDIARQTRQRPNDLSQMYHTCRLFPRSQRRRNVPYNAYFMAMRVVRKFDTLPLTPDHVLAEILRQKFTQHRHVTAFFSAKMRAWESGRAPAMATIGSSGQLFNRAYHVRFQSLRNVFPDGSIKVLHIDPPYIYPHRTDGRYAGGSASQRGCDNDTAAESIALVTDLLRDWQPKLAAGGVLLLWQAAGPLVRPVSDLIEQHRWAVERVVIWDKGRPQAGDFASPYAPQSEWLWVLKRPGERLMNHDNSPRGDILRFTPVSVPHLAGSQRHAFEKPVELCQFLIGKHSNPGELIFDACGCTASMSIAAIQSGRQWVYAESHLANYRLGVERVSHCVGTARAAG